MGSPGFAVNLGKLPATIRAIVVSPNALAKARIKAATTPERPALKTTFEATSRRVAPKA